MEELRNAELCSWKTSCACKGCCDWHSRVLWPALLRVKKCAGATIAVATDPDQGFLVGRRAVQTA